MGLLDFTQLWSWSNNVAPIPPIPPVPPPAGTTHSPGNWRTAHPRMRRIFLRGILPEEFESGDLKELQDITGLFNL